MKKRFAVILVMTLLVAGIAGAGEKRGPKISVTEDRYDLGNILQGAKATHTFNIANTGNEPLIIDHVQPG